MQLIKTSYFFEVTFKVIMICITSLLAEGEVKVYTQRFS